MIRTPRPFLRYLFLGTLLWGGYTYANDLDSTENSKKNAIQFSLDSKSDLVGNLAGGTTTGALGVGMLLGSMNINWEKIISIPGLTGSIQLLQTYGAQPSAWVGDYQGTDNASAPHFFGFYQAWLQQNFDEGHLSFLVGLHDLNTEFYVTDSASSLFNNSFSIGPELSRSGRNGPSLLPITALGARLKITFSDEVVLTVAAYDGVPGDPNNSSNNSIILSSEDGFMGIAQLDYLSNFFSLPGKVSIGGWGYSRTLDSLSEVDADGVPVQSYSAGGYILYDQKIIQPAEKSPNGVYAFIRLGAATAQANPIVFSSQFGLTWKGPLNQRPNDQFSFGVAIAAPSSYYQDATLAKGMDVSDSEVTTELNYLFKFNDWIQLQPDLQWVHSPGLDPNPSDAWVSTLRLELTFN